MLSEKGDLKHVISSRDQQRLSQHHLSCRKSWAIPTPMYNSCFTCLLLVWGGELEHFTPHTVSQTRVPGLPFLCCPSSPAATDCTFSSLPLRSGWFLSHQGESSKFTSHTGNKSPWGEITLLKERAGD